MSQGYRPGCTVGPTASLIVWLNMSGHSKWSRERNYFILPIFTELTHIHECIHSQKCAHARARRHADAGHEHTPSVKELDVNQDADERQLNTHIPSWTCYRFACAVYVSECTKGCLCNHRQAGEKWNGDLPTGLGHIAMLHTGPAPSPGLWLISPVKMFTQRIPLSNAWQFNFNPSHVKIWTYKHKARREIQVSASLGW